MAITAAQTPDYSLLGRYARQGAYTDCYVTSLPRRVELPEYIEAFYTTPLFRLERLILAAAGMPSSDTDAQALATGKRISFAAWQVEDRTASEIVLAAGRTRSWLMVMPEGAGTRLCFGSAIVPRSGRRRLGFGYEALLGFHQLYSRALLRAARTRLESRGRRANIAPE